jgi:hypothetical protein
MLCSRCGGGKKAGDRGWVTVLDSDTRPPPRLCPDCLAKLVSDGWDDDDVARRQVIEQLDDRTARHQLLAEADALTKPAV